MLDHLDYTLIDKGNVIKSSAFLIYSMSLTLFFGGLIYFLINPAVNGLSPTMGIFILPGLNLLPTINCWLPAILAVLFIEYIFIHTSSTEKTIKRLFVFEYLICLIPFLIILPEGGFLMTLAITFTFLIGQLWRWNKLKMTGELYRSAPSVIIESKYAH